MEHLGWVSNLRLSIYSYNGTQYILWWNVRFFRISKNECAHRFQHTRFSLGLNFCSFLSMIFRVFWVWKLKSRVLCTARYVQFLSVNYKIISLYESLSRNLCVVVFSASSSTRIDRKWRHQKLFEFKKKFHNFKNFKRR